MIYIAVALHNTSHGKTASVICVSDDFPRDALVAAYNAEALGYQFYEDDTGIYVFCLNSGEYVFRDQYKYLGERPLDYPIVFSLIRRDNQWIQEWLDRDLAEEFKDDPLDLSPEIVPPTQIGDRSVPVTVRIVDGDIIDTPADALISLNGSVSMWRGELDMEIQRVTNRQFHNQLAQLQPEQNQVIHVPRIKEHDGAFRDMIFLIDDTWLGPLSDLIELGLVKADQAGLTSVTMPTFRVQRHRRVTDKGAHEALRQLAVGVDSYLRRHPSTSLREITIVVDHDPDIKELLTKMLAGRVTVES